MGIRTTLIVSAALAAAGAASMATYEHTVPWGLAKRLEREEKSLPGRLENASRVARKQQLADDTHVINTTWRPQLKACQNAASTTSQETARQLDALRSQTTTSRTAAYRLGQASCGASNAKTPGPGAAGSVPTGSLPDDTDLRSVLGPAAYAPGR